MNRYPAHLFPGAKSQPLDYPGLRPSFSFVYYRGEIIEIATNDPARGMMLDPAVSLNEFLRQADNEPIETRYPVLAIGSNGCPGRLEEKYDRKSDVAIPVLHGRVADIAVVYSRTLAPYAALPATYVVCPGASSRIAVTFLTKNQLAVMDRTESLGDVYLRREIASSVVLDLGWPTSGTMAYLDRRVLTFDKAPTLLSAFVLGETQWAAYDERAILGAVMDRAMLLPGLAIEDRHRALLTQPEIRNRLDGFLASGPLTDREGRMTGPEWSD